MPTWVAWILDYLIKKIVPVIIDWAKRTFRKIEIDREVDDENLELREIKKQIIDYQEKNGTKEIPPNLKARLLEVSRKRVRGLQ